MSGESRRVVTGHDAEGKSIILSDGPPPQHHAMQGRGAGADFIEIWNISEAVPTISSQPESEPNEKPFTIMPPSGHLLRIIDIYPPAQGGHRTPMHRTKTIDYVVVIEGEIVLILDDSEVVLRKGEAVVQRGTNHAWENRSDSLTRMAFFHIDAEFNAELLAKLPQPLELMR